MYQILLPLIIKQRKKKAEHVGSKSLRPRISRGKMKLSLTGGKATQPTWKAAYRIP